MLPGADVPLLTLPGGSVLQFLLMTLPLLGVYIYFLYLAFDRPNIANPNDPRYAEDRIKLMDILYTYLATLVLFCSLVVYLLWFVRKRRRLSKRYEKEAIVILGNVEYRDSIFDLERHDNCCLNVLSWMINGFTLRNNYGRVVYDLERVSSHPAYDGRKSLRGVITKKVRVYYRYPREQVSILVLPNYPYSGQPKVDMEADWASFSNGVGLPSEEDRAELAEMENNNEPPSVPQVLSRDRSKGVLLVLAFWVCFLLGASLFLVYQIETVEEYYQDESSKVAWNVFWIVIGGVVPVVSLGGNYLRWKMYENWILRSGRKKKSKKRSRREEEFDEEEEHGDYVQMT